MKALFEFFTFACINFLGVMSPGPDFAIVTRYGIAGSRKAAVLASLGITSALLVHVAYCLLGVAVFLKSSLLIFQGIQIAGACYLGYLGVKMVFEKPKQSSQDKTSIHKKAFTAGFLTNLLNPKATLFLLSLFTQFVTPQTPLSFKIAYAGIIPLSALSWFCFLSYILTHPAFYAKIQRYQKGFTFVMGLFLLALAVYMFSTALGLL
jgi:RhtB (resistance to homoserine/threonine) family protein